MDNFLRRGRVLLLTLFVLVMMLPGAALAQEGRSPGDERPTEKPRTGDKAFVPGQIIVKFEEGASPEERADVRREEGLKKIENLDLINAAVFKVEGRSAVEAVRDLRRLSEVEYAVLNHIVYPTGYSDDPEFGNLWGLDNTGQPVNGGAAGTSDVDINGLEANAPDASGAPGGDPNLAVAVIDTGVDFSHPDLADRKWVNPGETPNNNVDDDNNGYVDDVNGWDFFNDDNTVYDSGDGDEHGTHVSGTIAASANGQGVVGVAPNVKIMSLKFLGPNGGSTSDAIKAIEYAKKEGAKISNNSWGGGSSNQALKDAIEASGSLFVAAAGNNGCNLDSSSFFFRCTSYPASYNSANILSVAAINNKGKLASFSNYGTKSVDISAPGVDILSTLPGDTYDYYNGTSMATPHATGAAALVASDTTSLLGDPVALKKVLMDSGKAVSDTANKTVTGDMIDANAALGNSNSDPGPDPDPENEPPTITNLSPAPGSTVSNSYYFFITDTTIAATVRDGQTELQKSDIRMKLNGSNVTNFNYDTGNDRLTYTSRLEKRQHTVEITATDEQGLSTTESWSFTVQ